MIFKANGLKCSRYIINYVQILIISFGTYIHLPAQSNLTITLRPDVTFQTIDNFGSSEAFELREITEKWSTPNLNKLADLLFSTEFKSDGSLVGIGLSGFRLEIGAGSFDQGTASKINRASARTKCPLLANGTYDWSKMDAELFWAKKAYEYKIHTLMGFSNSPPVYFTRNGLACRTPELTSSNLRADAYDDFAEYLAQVAAYFERQGVPLHYISPVNEPQWDWFCTNQEGSQWHTSEIYDLVKELQPAFSKHKVPTKINITEAGSLDWIYNNWDTNTLTGQLRFWKKSDPLYVGDLPVLAPHISGHSYWTEDTDERLVTIRSDLNKAINETDPKLSFWQTEYSFLGDGYKDLSENPTQNEMGLFLAKIIHSDLTIANASTWQYWETFHANTNLPRFRLVQVNNNNQTATPDKTYWALGHYSRFIRPGMVRIQTESSKNLSVLQSVRDVMTTSFLDPKTGDVTVVVVNYTNQAQAIQFQIAGVPGATLVSHFLSTNSLNMSPQKPFTINTPVNMPSRAISTLIFKTDLRVGVERRKTRESVFDKFHIKKLGSQTMISYSDDLKKTYEIKIRDLRRRVVYTERWSGQKQFQILDIKPGLYFLSVSGHATKAVLVE